MNNLKFLFVALLSTLLFAAASSSAQEVRVAAIQGGKKHACLFRAQSNLLISLAKKKVGRVLVFATELKAVSKSIKKTKISIAQLKGRTDSASNSKRKKLKKSMANFKLLSKGIVSCRDGITSQGFGVDCSDAAVAAGSPCDDLNPCTAGDICQNSACVGTPVTETTVLNCSFGACAVAVTQCVNQKFVSCIVDAAGSEICNGIDDDCNGTIDEGNACPPVNSVPTPTAVPTATVTATANPTGNPAPTPTSVSSPTASRTPTQTSTSVSSQTSVPTATRTATRTSTATAVATLTPTQTATNTFIPTANATATPTQTATRTATRTSTATATATRTSTRTVTPTPTRTRTPTPGTCFPADNTGSNSAVGCACLGTFDCCGICGATNSCAGANRGGAGADPGAAPSCFTQNCQIANNAGDNSENGCPCIGTRDCCGICSATGFCTGAKRGAAGPDPGGAASCPV